MIILDRKCWKNKFEVIKVREFVIFRFINIVRKGKEEIVVSGVSHFRLICSVYVIHLSIIKFELEISRMVFLTSSENGP